MPPDLRLMIEDMIAERIREHEVRVGWISGLIGVAFIAGIFHAFWLLKQMAQG
jgi:hypothetical protein